MALKLLAEIPEVNELEILHEEKNSNEPRALFVRGPYLGAEVVNKNKRIYSINEMAREVSRYVDTMVKSNRAIGELNHPASADVNPERACHLVVELKQEGNTFVGKSKVLSTPMGMIMRSLINDGVKIGMSSRALGKLIEEGSSGVQRVTDMRLVAVDCVADPSFTKAFVNGILESKQYVLKSDGTYEEFYNTFQDSLVTLPRHEVQAYLKEQVVKFIQSLNTKR